VKERQFRIGYEIERFEGLISAYRSGGDDMPELNAAALEDLDRLRISLKIGVDKLERWNEFRRDATQDPLEMIAMWTRGSSGRSWNRSPLGWSGSRNISIRKRFAFWLRLSQIVKG
jgi:hypothetical protein